MSKKYNLEIFDVLDNIRAGNMEYYNELSPIQKKGFYPVVVYHWLVGEASKSELTLLDAIVNPVLFTLGKYPDVLYKLMVSCMVDDKSKRHKYIKKGKQKTHSSLSIEIIKKYYECSSIRANDYLDLMDICDVKELGYELGYSEKEIKKIK